VVRCAVVKPTRKESLLTDSRLRELERRWKESGRVDDEAAYLLEKVRVGELAQEKLELAAYCYYQPAILALGDSAPCRHFDLLYHVGELGRWGKETCVRAAVTAAQSVYATWSSYYPDDYRPRRATQSAIHWVLCSSENHRAAEAANFGCFSVGYLLDHK